jgi:hypothetical protein
MHSSETSRVRRLSPSGKLADLASALKGLMAFRAVQRRQAGVSSSLKPSESASTIILGRKNGHNARCTTGATAVEISSLPGRGNSAHNGP